MSRHQETAKRRYASLAEAAEYLGGDISERTIRRWIEQGLIGGYRVGAHLLRVDLAEIDRQVIRQIPTAGR